MVYRYKKLYRIKKNKPILGSRFLWLGILIAVIIGGTLYFLFFSGIFQIKKISITGADAVREENIKAFFTQKNIFLIDTQKIEKEILDNFPQIATAQIHRGFPDALSVAMAERLAVAVWCKEDKCFLMDNEAVIFTEASSTIDGLIKISGSKEMLDKEKISQILEIQEKLKENLQVTTTRAFIVSEERLNIKTSESWEIYFNLKGDLNWQLQELGLVLEKQITPAKRKNLEYIDLRFSRVYYK